MRNSTIEHAPAPLLTAVDATSQIHLIVGSNPLAAARCARCLEVGAKPIIIAPENADLHFSIRERIESGLTQWVKRPFQDEDLKTLGREEVDHVVDTVFVTLGGEDPLSTSDLSSIASKLAR
jgi:uroporphyrin-III C-methyltransferase